MAENRKAHPHRRKLTDKFVRTVEPPKDRDRITIWDTESALGLRVSKSGNKTWAVVYQHDRRSRWMTLGKYPALHLKEARESSREVIRRAGLGEDPQAEKIERRYREDDRLEVVAERYLEEHAKVHIPKSWEHYRKVLRRYWVPKLGQRPIEGLARRDIKRVFQDLTKVPGSANAALSVISAVLEWAVDEEIIDSNPARGIKRNPMQGADRWLSAEDIARVWPHLVPQLRLTLITGQRPGEVCRAYRPHFDLEGALWSMPLEDERPKTHWRGVKTKIKKPHTVPLSGMALKILEKLETEGALWSSPKIPSTREIWKALEIERFRPHDLRATAATHMDKLGVPMNHISKVLNHAEGGTTKKYVRHEAEQQKRSALNRWAAHLTDIVEGRETGKVVTLHGEASA